MMAVAQTQQGVVKTRGRMVNGMLRPGKGLASATVKIAGRQAVVSQGKEGRFSFPVSGQKFRIESVQKKDYQLVDMSVCTEHEYSKKPIEVDDCNSYCICCFLTLLTSYKFFMKDLPCSSSF